MKTSRLCLLLCLLIGLLRPAVAEPGIERVLAGDRGRFETRVQTDALHYYILKRGPHPGDCTLPVSMARGTGGIITLADSLQLRQRAFFRIQEVPVASPLDTDGDGEDDIAELAAMPAKSPLNPAHSIAAEDGAVLLTSRAEFDAISHRDNFPGAPDVREVKFLIRGVDTAHPELYFLNLNRHIYHYYFAQLVLGYTGSLSTFNDETYFSNTVRRNVAGSLVVHESWQGAPGSPAGITVMEFWPSDPVSYPFVQTAYDLISRAMPWMETPLAYHPASETQRTLQRTEAAQFTGAQVDRLQVISSEALAGQTRYTLLNPGVGYGRLILYEGAPLSARDIPIFRTLPSDITRTAGIITAAAQTPLSHINLKAKQNNTPNIFLRDAAVDPRLTALLGKYVRFEPGPDDFSIREATAAEVDTWLEALRPQQTQTPVSDLTVQNIRPLSSTGFASAVWCGAKAANVAEMRKFLPPEMVPDGFAVPFYFYDQFMRANELYTAAATMMAQPGFASDAAVRKEALKNFRETIRAAPAPAWIISALDTVQASFPPGQGIRCRSSTNNEDLEGFSGAGLYDSYTHRDGEGPLIHSVQQVWASLWNLRAWDERDFYRVDHLRTMMGVLITANFDDETANGVGVTRNLIDPAWTGYYINAQVGESLVTNPDPNAIPEEFLIAQLLGQTLYEVQYVTFSNLLPEGSTVLTRAQAEALADRMRQVQSHFRSLYAGNYDFAMEVEWKITSTGQLIIKQARPWVE